MLLHNKLSKEELKKQLEEENFSRKTLSFYRYVIIEDRQKFRDHLYLKWFELDCKGRVCIAREAN